MEIWIRLIVAIGQKIKIAISVFGHFFCSDAVFAIHFFPAVLWCGHGPTVPPLFQGK